VNAPPTLTQIAPTNGVQGTNVNITLTGTNFVAPATINLPAGSGLSLSGTPTVASSTSITATLVIASTATLGAQNVSVTCEGVTTSAVSFTVKPPAPTISSFSPAGGVFGTTPTVTITGTNFVATTGFPTLQVANGANITFSNITVMSSTTITATFTMPAAPFTNNSNITVTTAGGTSNPVTFGVGTNFTIPAPNPASQTVTRGTSPGMTVFTLTPGTANSPFPATVNFTVSGLPTESTCTLNGTACSSFTLAASAGTAAVPVTLVITTTAPSLVGPRRNPGNRGPIQVQPWVLLASLALFSLLLALQVRRRHAGGRIRFAQYAMAILLVMTLAGMAAACGGGSSGPPPNPGSQPTGLNNIQLIATSGNASAQATFGLTLQ